MAHRQPPPTLHLLFSRIVLPLFVVLVVGALATGYYYFRVTGSPIRMAYQVNRDTYAMPPYFIWQTPPPEPTYHHAEMRDFYRAALTEFETNRTFTGYLHRAAANSFPGGSSISARFSLCRSSHSPVCCVRKRCACQ